MENPFNKGIRLVLKQISNLEWTVSSFLPSLITGIVLLFALLVLYAMWIFGLLVMLQKLFTMLMVDTINEIKINAFYENIPYIIILGIYFIAWLPITILSSPFLILGWFARYISNELSKS